MKQKTAEISDPGLELGKVVVKIGQLILLFLALFFFYLGYQGQFGFFSDWNIQIDPGIGGIFSNLSSESIVSLFCIGVGVKFLLLLALLTWVGRKID